MHFRKGLALLAWLGAAACCFGQYDVATVIGTITDASGAIVPRANLRLENVETGVNVTTLSDGNGIYRFLDIRIGRFRVTAQAPGFRTVTTEEFTLAVAARQRVDISLQVGDAATTVTVNDAAAVIETDSSNRGQVVRHETIVDLPLNGRAYADLALLAPGVRRPVVGNVAGRDGAYNVNGMRSAFNSFILDGIDNNAYGTSNQGFSYQVVQASPDAVQEFRVDTNNYSAEYGRAAGAVVNATIRSGTNQFHGSAWDFLRNTQLNATGFFKPTGGQKPTLVQNQFGGALGGPIKRDKLFFFADYEGFRSSAHTLSFSTLPTPAQKQGNLGIPITNPFTGQTYSDGVVPASQITAFAKQVLGDLPDPNLPSLSNNYASLPATITPSNKGDAKIDYYWNSKLTLFGRFSDRLQEQSKAAGLPGPSGAGGDIFRSYNRSVAIGATWTINPRSLLDLRLGLTRMEGEDFKFWELDSTPGMLALYGIPGTPEQKPIASGLDKQTISGYAGFGHDGGQHQNPDVVNPKADYTHTFGRHTFKAGAEFQNIATEILDLNPLTGTDTYAGQFSKPKGASSNNLFNLADFLFGARDSYTLNSYGIFQYRQQMYFGYVQDDFKVSRKLTLNLGLRYEFATPQYDANNKMSNFDPATHSLTLAKDGSLYDRGLVNPDTNDFGPRVGMAYSVTSKTVIRGGYGISYEHFHRSGRENLLAYNGPYVVNAAVNQTPALPLCTGEQFNGCFRTTQMGYPANFTAPSNFDTSVANIHYIPKDTPSMYVQSWHLSVQQALAKDLVLDVAYVGNRGVHVYQLADYNQAAPNLPGQNVPLAQRRPVANFGIIQIAFNETNSWYNALQLKLEKRFSKGFYLLNSFAWAKSLDIAPSNMEAGNGDNYYMNFRNWKSNKGISDYDQPFQNTTSVVWNVPVGKGMRFGSALPAAAEGVFGGWRISALNTMTSGQPLNFAYNPSTAATLTSGLTMRPNLVGNPFLPADQRTPQHYFNAAAFAVPDPSQPFGNAGRNIGRGDGFYQLDLAIAKSFPILSETRRLEFRSEWFNALNKTNFQAPASNISNNTFGSITSTLPARQIQFALKFIF
jgi:Carboxypeptidase regulatory-like domain/TonB dependent receptor-like, beta-barrel/TonB-dependent Receptor Plug Domain